MSATDSRLSRVATNTLENDVFRLLVDSVKDYAIFVLSPDGNVLTWNQGAQALKGYSREEIIGLRKSFVAREDIGDKLGGSILKAFHRACYRYITISDSASEILM